MKTLNHDEEIEHNYEPYAILYGKSGWTDAFESATIDLLVATGAIRLHKVVSGIGWETRIYVSNEGVYPL